MIGGLAVLRRMKYLAFKLFLFSSILTNRRSKKKKRTCSYLSREFRYVPLIGFETNSQDNMLHFEDTFFSVLLFDYNRPYFGNRILGAADDCWWSPNIQLHNFYVVFQPVGELELSLVHRSEWYHCEFWNLTFLAGQKTGHDEGNLKDSSLTEKETKKRREHLTENMAYDHTLWIV